MNKSLKIILMVVGAALIATICFFAVLTAQLTDGTDVTPDAVKADSTDFKTRIGGLFATAMDDVAETDEISFMLDETQIELLLGSAIREKNKTLTAVDVTKIENGLLSARIGVKFGAIKTIVTFTANGNVNGDVLTLKLKSFQLGNLKDKYRKIFLSDKKLNKMLADYGFSQSGGQNVFTFELSKLGEKVKPFFEENENKDVFSLLVDKCLDGSAEKRLFFGNDGKIGAIISMKNFEYNEAAEGHIPYDVQLADVKAKLSALYAENTVNSGNANTSLKYLVQGYSPLSDEEKATVDGMDFSEIGIASNSAYGGTISPTEYTILSVLSRQTSLISYIPSQGVSVKVLESDIGNIFTKINVIGTGWCLINPETNSLVTIAVESLYAVVENDVFHLKLIVNLNGLRIVLSAEFQTENNSDLRLDMKMNSIRIGSKSLSDGQKTTVLNYFGKCLEEQAWIVCDAEGSAIRFDFSEALNLNSIAGLISFALDVNTSARKVGTDEGYLEIKITSALLRW